MNMNWMRNKISAKNIKPYIRINSLKQLVNLSRDLHQPLIIDAEGDEPTIEIYDDWRE